MLLTVPPQNCPSLVPVTVSVPSVYPPFLIFLLSWRPFAACPLSLGVLQNSTGVLLWLVSTRFLGKVTSSAKPGHFRIYF